jgi:hypothetical protein
VGEGELAGLEALLKVMGIDRDHDEIHSDLVRQVPGKREKPLGSLLLTVAEHIADLHDLALAFGLASGYDHERHKHQAQPDCTINLHDHFLF